VETAARARRAAQEGYDVISGISSAGAGLQLASARFDAAAERLVASTTDDGGDIAAGAVDFTSAAAGATAARFAFLASLRAALTTNEMLDTMLKLH
jgi:hypothetical protein